jgi:hypothetical protein
MNKLNTALALTSLALMAVSQTANAADYEVKIVNLTRGIHITPVLVTAHASGTQLFQSGQAASTELQAMAEGGDTSGLTTLVQGQGAVTAAGTGLIAPGGSETLTISNSGNASNDKLSVVGMLLPTNDGFAGLNGVDLPTGDVGSSMTWDVVGYDAGTEANDEIIGSGVPGAAGFPAPAPIVATGTGTGGTGVSASVEGYVHVHRNVLGDTNASGGASDINSTVHRWLNPVARVTVTLTAN